MQTADLHKIFLQTTGVSTDTRSMERNSLFFALKGANFNANEFALQALDKGASYAVVDKADYALDPRYLLVQDSLKALQDLAKYHRQYLQIPIVGLTGSNGKTTTKELIRQVLSTKYHTVATKGNLNNHIGVPLTLLSMNREVEIGIVEMGANHRQEIAFLADIAQPDLGYITNFGKAHLEGFGGYQGVIAGKSELYDFLKSRGKSLVLNFDDPIQEKHAAYSKKLSFGSHDTADLQVNYLQKEQYAAIEVGGYRIESRLTGSYNAPNIAAAVAIGSYFDIPISAAKQSIEAYVPENNRSQIIERDGVKIILDAYNANPTSMAAALDNFIARPEPYKMAILGDMFELGTASAHEHQEVADRLNQSNIDHIILVGEHFYQTKTNQKIRKFKNFEGLKNEIPGLFQKGALVLIKGSRAMALERILDAS